ncbi:hypothetical protein ACXH32_001845 [Klebsiella pneumoniae]
MTKQVVASEDFPEPLTKDSHIEPSKQPVCGIIMPIADIDGYPIGHWRNVYEIINEASTSAGFRANLVSSDEDVAVIQKRIVQNIYDNPIIVCDISAKNANVMFELGMRLAFDKPTVIIKDERTPYSFDISSIEHLEYPSDLRYQSINLFKEKLIGKIKETHSKSISDPSYSTFLKHFGTFKIAQLDQKEVSEGEYLISEIKDIKSLFLSYMSNRQKDVSTGNIYKPSNHPGCWVNFINDGAGNYTVELSGLIYIELMVKKVIEKITESGLHITNFGYKENILSIRFESFLTKEEEITFKNCVASAIF